MTPERVREHLSRRLPRFEADGPPIPLSDQAHRFVWRVEGRPSPVVVKAAGPVGEGAEAGAPGWPRFEARSLEVLGPDGPLAALSLPDARPPRLLDFDEGAQVLVEEDVGAHPDLSGWLLAGRLGEGIGARLGRFVGGLHATSRARPELAALFERSGDGVPAVAALLDGCREAAIEVSDAVVARAEAWGRHPGRCLVVGCLRPGGVLVAPEGVRLVDWSAARFGTPADDVGYLAAHLWMRIHRAPSVHAAVQASIILRDFLSTYAAAGALDGQEVDDCAIAFGVVLLASALDPVATRSLYGHLSPASPVVREAVAIALRHIRAPGESDMFSVLRAQPSGT